MLKDKLKECRLQCDLSQQKVAEMLNMHRSTYSYYELGKTEPSLDNIRTLARIFNVSLNELLEVEYIPSAHHGMADPGYEEEFERAAGDKVNRMGDLTRDEKTLILRFRLMTGKQRKELLQALSDPGSEDTEPTE